MSATPSEIEALRAALAAAEARASAAEADAARARAVLSNSDAMIAALKLEIEKLRRALYGTKSECKARLLDQLELQLEELEATATQDELAAERVAVPADAPPPLRCGAVRGASRSRRTCHGSGWWSRRPRPAAAVARAGS